MENLLSRIRKHFAPDPLRIKSQIQSPACEVKQDKNVIRTSNHVAIVRKRTRHLPCLLSLIAIGVSLQVRAAPKQMTFEQAVKEGTSLKGCPKRDIGLIEFAYVTDSEANPEGVRPGKPIYLVLSASGATDLPVMGPLATLPTEQQLQALKGRRMCVFSE